VHIGDSLSHCPPFRRPVYYNHFVDLVKLIQLCLKFELTGDEIFSIESGFHRWVKQYEKCVFLPRRESIFVLTKGPGYINSTFLHVCLLVLGRSMLSFTLRTGSGTRDLYGPAQLRLIKVKYDLFERLRLSPRRKRQGVSINGCASSRFSIDYFD